MSSLLFGSAEYRQELYNAIRNNTGLDAPFTIIYSAFLCEASLSDGIVMPDGVKHSLQEYMLICEGKNDGKHFGEYQKKADEWYNIALDVFETKKLITYHISESGYKYPRIIGYNYFDDPKFFIAYRKKGDDSWNGRMSASTDLEHLIRHLDAGYEFREKEVMQKILN
jgi:hypothetical protein